MKKVIAKPKVVSHPVISPSSARDYPQVGMVFTVIVAMAALFASVIFYLRTAELSIATTSARGELVISAQKMAELKMKLDAYEQGKIDAKPRLEKCYAEPIAESKNGDAQLVCVDTSNGKTVVLESIRVGFSLKDTFYAPIVAASLGDANKVYIISGVKGNSFVFHVWTYDLNTGATTDLAER